MWQKGLSCTLCSWLVWLRQCFWTAEMSLPFSWAVPTEHTGNTLVALPSVFRQKSHRKSPQQLLALQKANMYRIPLMPPESLERWIFLPWHIFHRALSGQLKAVSTVLCAHQIKHGGFYFLSEQTAWLGQNFCCRHLNLKDAPMQLWGSVFSLLLNSPFQGK